MRNLRHLIIALSFVVVPLVVAQDTTWRTIAGWAKMPDGRTWGSTSALDVDRNGNLWVFERCGASSCAESTLQPILEFDPAGKFLRGFGEGLFVFPHSLHIDREGNIWVADASGKDGKGHVVVKFNREGKYITEWKQFGRPSGIYIDASDTLYVADHQSDAKRNPGMRRGIRVGSAKDGTVKSHIPGVGPEPDKEILPEGVAADGKGAIYGAEVALKNVTKYVRN